MPKEVIITLTKPTIKKRVKPALMYLRNNNEGQHVIDTNVIMGSITRQK